MKHIFISYNFSVAIYIIILLVAALVSYLVSTSRSEILLMLQQLLWYRWDLYHSYKEILQFKILYWVRKSIY